MARRVRGINVGGHAKIKMDALRKLYVSLKLQNPQTYIQSGNVIFKTDERDLDLIAPMLIAILAGFGRFGRRENVGADVRFRFDARFAHRRGPPFLLHSC